MAMTNQDMDNSSNAHGEDEVLAVARASAGRRILGLTSLAGLGVLLIYVAFASPPTLLWQVFLIGIGAGAIWVADAMRRATASWVELTQTGLRDADGTVIAHLADIEGLDRGFFAFKPSNGFLMKIRTKSSNHWRPGLWWRLGRRIGIGGMTPGNQTKYMAEALAVLMAKRDGEL
jgi:hypothetical protein